MLPQICAPGAAGYHELGQGSLAVAVQQPPPACPGCRARGSTAPAGSPIQWSTTVVEQSELHRGSPRNGVLPKEQYQLGEGHRPRDTLLRSLGVQGPMGEEDGLRHASLQLHPHAWLDATGQVRLALVQHQQQVLLNVRRHARPHRRLEEGYSCVRKLENASGA